MWDQRKGAKAGLVFCPGLKLIKYNPAADVERPKKDNFVSGYYNAEQLTEMFEVFRGSTIELPVILAAYFTVSG